MGSVITTTDRNSTVSELDWRRRWWTVLRKLTLINNETELELELLGPLLATDRVTVVAFVNAHAMNCVVEDTVFADALLQADHVLRDGTGMHALLGWTGFDAGLNLNGTDLIPRLIARYDGRRIAFMGTTEPYLSAAVSHVQNKLAPSAQMIFADGFQAPEHYKKLAADWRPDLIVLGMGMPKQEAVSRLLRDSLTHPCVIVCGGAIIDFMGGKVQRSPAWMRRVGMEWLYRLAREPRRMFKRYVFGNPIFLLRARKLLTKRNLNE